MLVRMWMSSDPAVARPETPVGEALQLLASRKVRRLPVLAGDELVGMVTLGDLERVKGRDGVKVGDVMSRNPATVAAETPIEEAGRLVRDRKIGALPVLEGKQLVGIITETDIFRALIQVLGLDAEGTRVAVEISKEPESFYELMRLAGETGRAMHSVVLYHSYSREKALAVLRVEGSEAEDFVQKLWAAQYRVVRVG